MGKPGRPTKYKPEFCEQLIGYFDIPPWVEVPYSITHKNGSVKEGTERYPNALPKFHDFAKKIGVNEDTVVEWAKVHPEFSAAYKQAKELQKWFLIENGMNSLYNSTFTIFTAKNITDMRDEQKITHAGDRDNPIATRDVGKMTVEEVDDYLKTKLNASTQGDK